MLPRLWGALSCDALLSASALQERRAFDDRFMRRDSSALCDLTSAADALEMRALVDLGEGGLVQCCPWQLLHCLV